MNFKLFVVGIFCILLLVKVQGQEWMRVYGDSVNTLIYKLAEHYDKGYLFSGSQYENAYFAHGLLMKTDINGYQLWEKAYGFTDKYFQFFGSQIIEDGSILEIGITNQISASCHDPFIIKINACGEKEWCRIYNAPGCNCDGYDIVNNPDGGFMALIDRWETAEEKRIWLFRLDSIGEVIWAQAYATDPSFESEWSHSLLKTSDSCYIITGEAYYPDLTYPNKWIIKIILIKVNLNGEVIFEVPWGTNNGIYSDGRLSTIDTKNNIYTAGRRARKTAPYGDSPCLFKTSVTGEPIFYKDLKPYSTLGESGTINWFQDSTLVQCIDWFDTTDIDSTGLIKTDALGNRISEKFIFLNKDDILRTSDITFNNRLILAGGVYNPETNNWQSYAFKFDSNLNYDSLYTTSFTYDSLCPHPIVSDTISMDDCEVVIVGIDEAIQDPEKTKMHVFPNPATNKITLELPTYLVKRTGGQVRAGSKPAQGGSGFQATTVYHQWGSALLEAYDLYGRKMMGQLVLQADREVELDVSQWQGGMYVFRLSYRGETVATEKVVVE